MEENKVIDITKEVEVSENEKLPFYNTKWFIYSICVILGLIVIYFAWKL